MGELERQRQARDLWISRGHVVAYITGTLLLGLFLFGMGYRMGSQAHGETSRLYETSLVSGAPDEELVQVLDRVDAMKDPLGHKQMTFPELRDPRAGILGEDTKGGGEAVQRVPEFRLVGEEGDVWPEGVPVTQPQGWVVVFEASSEPEVVVSLQGKVDASGNYGTELAWGVEDGERAFWLIRQGFSSQAEAEGWLEEHRQEWPSEMASELVVREFEI